MENDQIEINGEAADLGLVSGADLAQAFVGVPVEVQ